jgi:hypothetical protein
MQVHCLELLSPTTVINTLFTRIAVYQGTLAKDYNGASSFNDDKFSINTSAHLPLSMGFINPETPFEK